MVRVPIVLLMLYLVLISCSQGMKGRLLTSVDIGTNTNNIFLWISYYGSNYVFYSYQDILSSSLDRNVKSFLDDNFYLPFDVINQEVWIINQVKQQLKIFNSSQEKTIFAKELSIRSDKLVHDIIVNQDKSILLLILENISYSDDYVYSIAFSKESSDTLEIYNYTFTNVFKIEVDEIGNFYVFQTPRENKIKIDVFSSSFIHTLSRVIDIYDVVLSNFVFSSVVVTKPFIALVKFDSLADQQKAEIFSFDLNLNKFSKKFEIALPRENFQMLSYLRNGFVACATYKGNLPTVMFFDPFSPSFKVSHEIFIDFQYPLMMRGFKVDKSGKVVVMFADFPDNRVLFYYWDLISVR